MMGLKLDYILCLFSGPLSYILEVSLTYTTLKFEANCPELALRL